MSAFERFEQAPAPWVWPVPRASLKRVGQSVLSDRDGSGRPHFGLDVFAAASSPVLAAQAGQVVRIVDGRRSNEPGKRRAGLWIDILASGLLCRYLHMGQVLLRVNQAVRRGGLIGFLGENPAGEPHLHFEIRRNDAVNGRYGDAVDPLLLLPKRTQDNV
jgi:murein DD-endopeptidase MepM/ murein hydrolase activator NlpD